MSTKPKRPQRPRELQDPLNYYLYHPLAWRLASLLAKTPLTPNVVSVIGALCVIGAAWSYAQPWFPESALLGLALHMTWHVVDGADGDLARLTGRASPIGEMVDGLCDYLSHVVLYLTLGWLLHFTMGWAAWMWMLLAGVSHAVQANHVEVQRRQYQYWVYGTPWIRQSHRAGSATAQSGFSGLVTLYINAASSMTPHALRIDQAVAAAQGDKPRLQAIRTAARARLSHLLPLCMVLGPNPRAIFLGFAMLIGGPGGHGALYYFVYQTVVLNLLLVWSVRAHNAAAKRIAGRIGA
ncbi:MAG: CDP-alcohol phosphatidyltransferase family protein [Novosphingobium sp.]